MPALRLSVQQIRKLLRLKFGSLLPTSDRQIAAQLGVARSTVSEYLERAHAAGLSTGVAVIDGHVHGDESDLVESASPRSSTFTIPRLVSRPSRCLGRRIR